MATPVEFIDPSHDYSQLNEHHIERLQPTKSNDVIIKKVSFFGKMSKSVEKRPKFHLVIIILLVLIIIIKQLLKIIMLLFNYKKYIMIIQ